LNHVFTKKSQEISQKEITVAKKRKRNYLKQKELK